MNILVSGNAGFIGSNLADSLISKGHKVVGIDNLSSGLFKNIHKDVIFYQRDIGYHLSDIFEDNKIDCVFHLAAQIDLRKSLKEPKFDAQSNIIGSLNLIENCIKYNVPKFIFVSTGGAIFDSNAKFPWDENTPTLPSSPYGFSKKTVEGYLEILSKLHGFSYACVRPANIYGPRQNGGESGIISIICRNMIENQDIYIYGDGTKFRDFLYIDDLINGIILIYNLNLNGIFNISSEIKTSINEIIKEVSNSCPTYGGKIYYKNNIIGEIDGTLISSKKIKNYGWNNNVNINKGIINTINYLKYK
jgi:UDP-glucose 4-epimerase